MAVLAAELMVGPGGVRPWGGQLPARLLAPEVEGSGSRLILPRITFTASRFFFLLENHGPVETHLPL